MEFYLFETQLALDVTLSVSPLRIWPSKAALVDQHYFVQVSALWEKTDTSAASFDVKSMISTKTNKKHGHPT